MSVIGDGRLIPLVILDTSDRPDLEELIRVHQHVAAGDVVVQWGQLEGRLENVALYLWFKRPGELLAIVEFDIVKQGGLVDQIMHVNGLYIQGGRPGDRLKHNLDAPKVILEVPDTGVRDLWDEKFHREIAARMRQDAGFGRQQAKRAARQYITEWRRFGDFRMRPSWPSRNGEVHSAAGARTFSEPNG
jgi:hypothetical protein